MKITKNKITKWTIIYCDKCWREIENNFFDKNYDYLNYDVCKECYNKFFYKWFLEQNHNKKLKEQKKETEKLLEEIEKNIEKDEEELFIKYIKIWDLEKNTHQKKQKVK
jgi:hypothetical protein